MIAEAAGISVGLLYNYFPAKADVLTALFEQSMHDVQASFAIAESAKTPAGRIERLVRSASEIPKRKPRLLAAQLQCAHAASGGGRVGHAAAGLDHGDPNDHCAVFDGGGIAATRPKRGAAVRSH